MIIIGVAAIILLAAAAYKFKQDSSGIQSRTRFLMDTYCTIQVPGSVEVLDIIDRAFGRIEDVDRKFSSLNPESPVYAFNNFNEPIDDIEVVGLIQTALNICKESDGAFDITIYPLIDLWGFFTETPGVPDSEAINECLEITGYNKLIIKNNTLFKLDEDVKIDLGAIAKGYAIGEALKVLRQWDIESALIDAGGDIYALGTLHSRPWKIGIQDPRGDGVIGVLELEDCAVVTSGDYERFFEKDGERYHHILNPKTGYSARGVTSVTVISSNPVLADAWSTTLFVMGREKGMELMKKNNSMETFMITDDGEKYYSKNMNVNTTN